MTSVLQVSIGSYSDKGRKPLNQDCHGSLIPRDSLLASKGVAVVMADGISSSLLSHIASETTVNSFLDDYYCTSELWSVQHSVERVLAASNAWLFSQTQHSPYRYDKDKGYVCTCSALVVKGDVAHVFHVGDTRVYRLNQHGLEQLTHDHRLWVSEQQSHLSRALGIEAHCPFDYQSLRVQAADVFILATDGVYEFITAAVLEQALTQHATDLQAAATQIVEQAYQAGSDDNLSLQIVRVEQLPKPLAHPLLETLGSRPFPPDLSAGCSFDGYRIVRQLHASPRSHVYLAIDEQTLSQVILKTPSIEMRADPAYLERFVSEEWIARRINSAYVVKAASQTRPRQYFYSVFEYIEGQSLAQWITDHPKAELGTVRGMVEQIARGLRAFHRMDMLHQDLKPDNIMIDATGTLKIIDFGSVWAAGLAETSSEGESSCLLGTALYAAPEYFLGEPGSIRSEQFSLAVIAYHMLSGRYPYAAKVARAKSSAAQQRLHYQSVLDKDREIPAWIDDALAKALQLNPDKRYSEISEFLADLRRPNRQFLNQSRAPLAERNPLALWQGIAAMLAMLVIFLLTQLDTS
ncbi:protein kinase domain-containing protein [Agarivorans sp. QJM3NY_25]|uniref:protein kinase domain-containing protein n=1 Tax=Agarivorans sp. QJM3NY_25 TaxID=3421430 RepID=UPI003D7E0F12